MDLDRSELLFGRGARMHCTDGMSLLQAVREDAEVVDFLHLDSNSTADLHAGQPLAGRRMLEVFPGPDTRELVQWLAGVLRTGRAQTIRRSPNTPGSPALNGRTFDLFACVVDSGVLMMQGRDVTEAERLSRELEHQALHDVLTGLPNRRWFADEVSRATQRLQRQETTVAVLFCDLDHFKFINDSLGHAAGDELLRQTAGRLRSVLRPTDSVARFGGDEMVVLLEDLEGPLQAVEVARRVHAAVAGSYCIGSTPVQIDVSLGVSVAQQPVHAEQLLTEADAALYEAKRLGRGQVAIYDAELGRAAADRIHVHEQLVHALGSEQFELHYQPQYCLRTGRIRGAEALLRWRRADGNLQTPCTFLAAAEETGLMDRIGAWVLHTACAEARRWEEIVPAPPRVQVNLSTRELVHPALPATLASALRTSGLPPERLEVEVTETHAPEDFEGVAGVLQEIRDLGADVALDDFGTGYSSLLWLRRFPVSTVKLDRSFVSQVMTGEADHLIVQSVIGLAHALGLSVVGEGIESGPQQQLLTTLGCDLGQGYHLGRPLPAAQFRALLEHTAPAGERVEGRTTS